MNRKVPSISCSHCDQLIRASSELTSTITRSLVAQIASNLLPPRAGAFDDDDVTHVEGELDPVRDLDIISNELRLKDIELLNGAIEKMEKNVQRANDKKLKAEYVSAHVLTL